MTVYEYGSGGSTLFFAKLVGRVVSIEHEPKWCAALQAELLGRGYRHVELRLASLDCPSEDRFAESEFALALPDEPADAIVIDSSDDTTWRQWARRVQLFPLAARRARPGGIIVVDDSWRYPELRRRHPSVRVFRGLGPARRGRLTSTDIYSL
jgi:predicted O-methyltransferase YrrM